MEPEPESPSVWADVWGALLVTVGAVLVFLGVVIWGTLALYDYITK